MSLKTGKLAYHGYHCKKHGRIGLDAYVVGVVGGVNKMFCAKCMVEKLEEIGICEATRGN